MVVVVARQDKDAVSDVKRHKVQETGRKAISDGDHGIVFEMIDNVDECLDLEHVDYTYCSHRKP